MMEHKVFDLSLLVLRKVILNNEKASFSKSLSNLIERLLTKRNELLSSIKSIPRIFFIKRRDIMKKVAVLESSILSWVENSLRYTGNKLGRQK